MENVTISTVEELYDFAGKFLSTLPNQNGATVIALSGDLGAGKTTFVQQLAQLLGISEPVTSPTFTVMKRYETKDDRFTSLLHMDAYRLESVDELRPLRFEELLGESKTLFCIEWAERIESALPEGCIQLHIEIKGEQRILTFG